MRIFLILTVAIIHFGLSVFNTAWGQENSLIVGEVKAINVPFEIRSILNGSDEVLNLNVEGPRTLIMTGMAPGRTNIIIFGSKEERSDFSISVASDQRDLVFLHEGASKTTPFRCNPRCEREKKDDGGSSGLEAALPATSGESASK
jgi:hypothetical protein